VPNEVTLEDLIRSAREVDMTPTDVDVSDDQLREAFIRVSSEKDALLTENVRLASNARTTEILDDLIKHYASRAFWFMVGYCGFVGIFLAAYAFGCFPKEIPASVLNFMVGSTATTVIGLVGMVLTGIFVGARPKG